MVSKSRACSRARCVSCCGYVCDTGLGKRSACLGRSLVPYARNVNPEWGYVAPAPSVMRTARLIAVTAIIGATAGAATVFSCRIGR